MAADVGAFVVSLLWGFLNPVHEKRVKEIIRSEYREFLAQALRVFGGRLELPPGDS